MDIYQLVLCLFVQIGCVHISCLRGRVLKNYAIIIDAGSSSSKGKVYSLQESANKWDLPNLVLENNHRVSPGLGTFRDNITAIDIHFMELITVVREHVPSGKHGVTPIYVMATAGR